MPNKRTEGTAKEYRYILILGFSFFWVWLLLNRGTLVDIGGFSISDSSNDFSLLTYLFNFAMLGLVFLRKVDKVWLVLKNVFVFLVVFAALLSALSYAFAFLIEPAPLYFRSCGLVYSSYGSPG
jgi:hypothetical protein